METTQEIEAPHPFDFKPPQLAPESELVDFTAIMAGSANVSFNFEGWSKEKWCAFLVSLKKCKDQFHLLLADAITHGTKAYGEEFVHQQLVQIEFDRQDASRAMAIGSLDLFARHPSLSSDHYWTLAQAGLSPVKQVKWSELAVKESLTPLRLKLSIAAGKVIPQSEVSNTRGSNTGLLNLPGIRALFDQWWKPLQDNDPVSGWDQDHKRAVLEELRAPMNLGLKLARDLGENP